MRVRTTCMSVLMILLKAGNRRLVTTAIPLSFPVVGILIAVMVQVRFGVQAVIACFVPFSFPPVRVKLKLPPLNNARVTHCSSRLH